LSYSQFLLINTQCKCIYRTTRSTIYCQFFLTKCFLLNRYVCNDTLFKSDNQIVFSIPFIRNNSSIGWWETNYKAFLGRSVNYNYLLLTNNSGNNLLWWVTCRTPFYLSRLGFYYEWILYGISLLIWNSKKFIFRTCYKEAFRMPVSMSYFLSMLWDTWNLSLALSVVEDKRTFLRTNTKYWMCIRPSNIRSLIFVWSEFNILEFSQAHRPYWDYIGSLF
jgi:hypothetical protein